MRTYLTPAVSTRQGLIEHDLAHIEYVLLHVSDSVRKNRTLPPSYWQERLRQIRDGGRLQKADLKRIDALQALLDRWLMLASVHGRSNADSRAGSQTQKTPTRGRLETIPEASGTSLLPHAA